MAKNKKLKFEGGGLVLFDSVPDAMQGEKILKKEGFQVKLVAPPPELRHGCDLALEINLVKQVAIERALDDADAVYMAITPIKPGTAELLEIVKVTDFGQWIMARAGNMKITFEKGSGVIVNVSGGGCPDIPYMHAQLINKKLAEAPRPKDIGFTLCSLNAERALEECIAIHQGGNA
ncbi:DUF3343 domain-containing protein [Chloroflexota bacterium]